ncbi:MAG: DMT family transporter [Alphaproteobacteria bacterium]|nr:DMT family transporter [Alphaproteobacteria bacterium]
MNLRNSPASGFAGLSSAAFHPILYPLLFVLLWGTGFIGARLGLPYADPYSFLAIRLLAASIFMAFVAWLGRAAWPRGVDLKHCLVSGLLIHLGYLGGVFTGVWLGCPPAVGALITGLQPLLTGLLAARILGEKINPQVIVGLGLGLVGVLIVLSDHLSFRNYNHYSLIPIVVALLSITAGTVYQKRFFGSTDIRAGSAVQYLLCGILFALPSLLSFLVPAAGIPSFKDIRWTGEFWTALIWLTMVLSVVSIALLFWLIRAYSASRVSSLMYLVPPTTAVEAWLLFGDPLSVRIVVGMGVVILGLLWGERARRLSLSE